MTTWLSMPQILFSLNWAVCWNPTPPKKQWILQKCFLYKRGKREEKKKQLAYKAAPIYVLAVPLKWQSGSVRWLLCREAHFKAGHFISDRQPQVEHEIKNKKEGEKEKEINTLDQASSFKPCTALCVGTFKSAPELCPNYTSTSCRRNLKID